MKLGRIKMRSEFPGPLSLKVSFVSDRTLVTSLWNKMQYLFSTVVAAQGCRQRTVEAGEGEDGSGEETVKNPIICSLCWWNGISVIGQFGVSVVTRSTFCGARCFLCPQYTRTKTLLVKLVQVSEHQSSMYESVVASSFH